MEQSTSGANTHIIPTSPSTLFTGDEREIADILLQLSNPIHESESRYQYSVKWGKKKTRSAINLNPPQSLSLQVERETEGRPEIKAEVSSPATPLSFLPSESDGKSKQFSKKVSKKRRREEWTEIINGLSQERDLLRGEIECMKSDCNKLKAANWELKAKRQEVLFHLGNPHANYAIKLNQPIIQSHDITQIHHPPQVHSMIHQQQKKCILDQTAYKSPPPPPSSSSSSSHACDNFQHPYGYAQMMGPLGIIIPDLNVAAAAEETFVVDAVVQQPLDHFRSIAENRAKAARRRRMARITEMKKKNSSSTAL